MSAREDNAQQDLFKRDPPIYRVSQLTSQIQRLLEDRIGKVWVEGEVSNLRRHSSGHTYFTLKDETAQIGAVLFAGRLRNVKAELRDGLQVRVFGLVSIYPKSSQYQIVVEQVQAAGLGHLYEAFEKLKAKLKAEGLFDRPKKPLPLLPQHIGIVTSPTGAAIRDIIKVLTRRFPNVHVLLAPVRVQGEGAALEIAAAIERLNERGGLDAIIVGRGGGSIEELWCFNEEIVARAIARSRIPVISAVGHETDYTISDFVADVRAPTPSAAAEMVVGRKDQFEEKLAYISKRLRSELKRYWGELEGRLNAAARSYVFREPENLLRRHWQTVDHGQARMEDGIRHAWEQRKARLDRARAQLAPMLRHAVEIIRNRIDEAGVRMRHEVELRLKSEEHRVERCRKQLAALNPDEVLKRGYSITRVRGAVIRDAAYVDLKDEIEVQLARGRLRAEVRNKEEVPHGGRK